MPLYIQKYGGTSMGSIERIKNVAVRVKKWSDAGYQLIIVTSAMSGETDRLLGLSHSLTSNANLREVDMLVSTGEQASAALLSMALNDIGVPAVSYAGWQIPVQTTHAYTRARILNIDEKRIRKELNLGRVVVITGFQGVDENGNITTLGRGGSDTSAVAIAAAVHADECQIFTDVDGVYTTDPRVEKNARRLKHITFEEVLEMASLGSKVLQTRSVELAVKYQVKTRVLSSLTDPLLSLEIEKDAGTLITLDKKDSNMEKAVISGIAFQRDEAQIVLVGVPDQPGVAAKILSPIAEAMIEVDMIIQTKGSNSQTDFMFTVGKNDYEKACQILRDKQKFIGASEIKGDKNVAKVSIVGVGMRSDVGITSKMFNALADEKINIQSISTSEIKVSILVDKTHLETAVKKLHEVFNMSEERDN